MFSTRCLDVYKCTIFKQTLGLWDHMKTSWHMCSEGIKSSTLALKSLAISCSPTLLANCTPNALLDPAPVAKQLCWVHRGFCKKGKGWWGNTEIFGLLDVVCYSFPGNCHEFFLKQRWILKGNDLESSNVFTLVCTWSTRKMKCRASFALYFQLNFQIFLLQCGNVSHPQCSFLGL